MLLRALKRFITSQEGFSLLELLGVAIILVILSLFALANVGDVSERARQAKSAEDLRVIEQALERHKADHGHYPIRLGLLRDKGYVSANFAFETAWSSGDQRIYYFYAVDSGSGSAQAYALGDPGSHAICRATATTTLQAGTKGLIPCGKDPSGDVQWAWYANVTLNLQNTEGTPLTGDAKPRSLGGFRPDLHTES